tara:strand:- start:275 stop:397 length:123 start_codon:yes stop_codon:yes gene_type:complete
MRWEVIVRLACVSRRPLKAAPRMSFSAATGLDEHLSVSVS